MLPKKRKNSEISDIAAKINDSFLANINHAMRTPLNALVGMIELMTKSGLDEDQLKYARIMRESTELLMLQLDNLIDLANIEAKELEIRRGPCRLEDIVKDALQPAIQVAVKKKIPLAVIYGPGVPESFTTDSKKITKVLTNLLSCALKFTERGKILLNITRENSKKQPKLRFSIENDKMLYDSLVSEIQRFKDFSTVDLREFGEISISLMTAKKLLITLGAGDNFNNLDNHKLPFYFELDIDEEEVYPRQSSYELLKGKRALILQDEEPQLNLLQQSLKLWGIEYVTISNEKMVNAEILSAIKEEKPFDLLFFSERLPTLELNGYKNTSLDCVLISKDFSSLSRSLHIEFSAYLMPPFHPNELLTTLLSFYDKASPYQEISLSENESFQISNQALESIDAKVMLVEDDFVSRMYTAELLESFGCKVAIAENGLHALTKLSSYSDYDIIFMDCIMPRLDGYTATQKIREAGHNTVPIVALSANSLDREDIRCFEAGMDGIIAKPVKEQELYSALKNHVLIKQLSE